MAGGLSHPGFSLSPPARQCQGRTRTRSSPEAPGRVRYLCRAVEPRWGTGPRTWAPSSDRHLRAVTTVRKPCPRRKTDQTENKFSSGPCSSAQTPPPNPGASAPFDLWGPGAPCPPAGSPVALARGHCERRQLPPPRRAMFTRHGVPKRRPAVAYFVVLGPVSPPPPFYKRRFFPQRPSNQARRRPPVPPWRSVLCLPPSALR